MKTGDPSARGTEWAILDFSVRRRIVMRFLLATTTVLLVAYIVTSWLSQSMPPGGARQQLLGLFDMNSEVSIPTWWSQTLLLVAAVLVLWIAVRSKTLDVKDRWTAHWFALAGFMLYASIDEGASIHEIALSPMRKLFNISVGIFSYAWVILGLAVVAVLVLVFLRFFLHLPKTTRGQFAVSLAIFLLGSVGVEMVTAYVVTVGERVAPMILTLLHGWEELFEMLGVILFIRALISYLSSPRDSGVVNVTLSTAL